MFSTEKVAEWVKDGHGIGDTIENGISSKNIQNEVLAEKWEQCAKLIEEIYYILEPYL